MLIFIDCVIKTLTQALLKLRFYDGKSHKIAFNLFRCLVCVNLLLTNYEKVRMLENSKIITFFLNSSNILT